MYLVKKNPALCILFLSAIWGSSFLFMRLLVPAIGSYWTAFLRISLGALFLYGVLKVRRESLYFFKYWRQYSIIGAFNSALPFVLYAFAARTLPSGYMGVLNATMPYWAGLVGWLWFGERLSALKWIGLAVGLTGVIFLMELQTLDIHGAALVAILACLGATLCYALASGYIKRYTNHPVSASAYRLAAGSQCAASLLLLPFMGFGDAALHFSPSIVLQLLAIGMLSTGAAYLVFYPLIQHIGMMKTSLVTFLIPVFAFFWGGIFLGEALTLHAFIGTVLILVGTAIAFYGDRR